MLIDGKTLPIEALRAVTPFVNTTHVPKFSCEVPSVMLKNYLQPVPSSTEPARKPVDQPCFDADIMADPSLTRLVDAACECWRSFDGKSRAFVDRQGRWLASDAKAKSLVADKATGIVLVNGMLRAVKEEQANLDRLLSVGTKREALVLKKAFGEGHILLETNSFDPKIVGLVLKDTDDAKSLNFASFEAAFGLTPSEANVMRLILNGHSASEAAELQGLSVNTVRAHLRHCYDKLNVSTREEMWRVVHPYQIG
ncbi:helix-turn-helix transcriptional regulator [Erythrobacter insulae]|uniref:Helix-turn-helix transcriptional regulator n=1 Tax=Erythrobacter insulae TaxID=2584124 RepID=A0A547PBT2_9SPHN|nr:LuxR C-terminal-related transcriptional regulator [Erythrobacter insulae]TRD11598.1 helix-turn-helix transcriptional regulator [Erythrobacter insulae]